MTVIASLSEGRAGKHSENLHTAGEAFAGRCGVPQDVAASKLTNAALVALAQLWRRMNPSQPKGISPTHTQTGLIAPPPQQELGKRAPVSCPVDN